MGSSCTRRLVNNTMQKYCMHNNHRRPPDLAAVGLNAPNILVRLVVAVRSRRAETAPPNWAYAAYLIIDHRARAPRRRPLAFAAHHCPSSQPSPNVKMSAAAVITPSIAPVNGNGHVDDTPKGPKFASGLILPPPEIKSTPSGSFCENLTYRQSIVNRSRN
jgi:hypothetical protein